jgi:hypothetical protein
MRRFEPAVLLNVGNNQKIFLCLTRALAPPSPYAMVATHATQPITIIFENAFKVKDKFFSAQRKFHIIPYIFGL